MMISLSRQTHQFGCRVVCRLESWRGNAQVAVGGCDSVVRAPVAQASHGFVHSYPGFFLFQFARWDEGSVHGALASSVWLLSMQT